MAYKSHKIGALILADKADEARRAILDALKKHGVNQSEAAKELGCSKGTLIRWIAQLGIGDEIEALRLRALKEGWAMANPSLFTAEKARAAGKRRWKGRSKRVKRVAA